MGYFWHCAAMCRFNQHKVTRGSLWYYLSGQSNDSFTIIYLRVWKSLSLVQLFVTPWTIWSMEFSRPEYWSGWPFPSPGALPNPGIEPRSPALQVDSLPAELQGKPKKTGVGGLCFLQRILPTEESNQGLLHCGRILYQLSYRGSPISTITLNINELNAPTKRHRLAK